MQMLTLLVGFQLLYYPKLNIFLFLYQKQEKQNWRKLGEIKDPLIKYSCEEEQSRRCDRLVSVRDETKISN